MDRFDVLMYCILLLNACIGVCGYNPHVWDTHGFTRQLSTRQGVNGCYKLLNATGAVGCEDPTQMGVQAPLLGIKDANVDIDGPVVALVPVELMDDFLTRLLSDQKMREQVAGVLVDTTTGVPAHSSQALPFPLEQYAPYTSSGYKWNPRGSGLNRQYMPFGVFALTADIVADAWRRADYNQAVGFKGALQTASLSLTMNAQGTSRQCITQQTCLPIGGHSVWAALPPLPFNATSGETFPSDKPIVLVTAQIDGTALFHDLIQGAESPLSGLFALLAATQCLQRVGSESESWPRRLVFMGLAGEAWDLMGSRSLLWALNQSTAHVGGLRMDLVQEVLEIGSVGRSPPSPNATRTFYAHTQPHPPFGDPSPLLSSLQAASLSSLPPPSPFPALIQPASAKNPGIPPSSLMAFLKVEGSIPGVVFTDFDSELADPYYESHLDGNGSIDAESVTAAAVVLARGVYRRAAGREARELEIDSQSVLDFVQGLISCWLSPSPGLLCPLLSQLMAPDYYMTNDRPDFNARHYIGVLPYKDPSHLDHDPDHPHDPYTKKNMARFLWNFFANATAVGGSLEKKSCDFDKSKCGAGEVCVGWKSPANLGVCMRASVSYVPARSTRVTMCPTCWKWNVTSVADSWSLHHGLPEDPLWAESFWPDGHPLVNMFHAESKQVEVAVLVAGVVLTVVSLFIALGTKNAFYNRLKSH